MNRSLNSVDGDSPENNPILGARLLALWALFQVAAHTADTGPGDREIFVVEVSSGKIL